MKLNGPLSSRLFILAFLAFVALAASGALRWSMYSPSHDEQRAVQLVLIWVVSAVFFVRLTGARAAACFSWCGQHRIIVLFLGFFFGIGAISSSLATLPCWAFLEWSHLLLLLVCCLALAVAIGSVEGAQDWLYLSLVAAGAFYAAQVMVRYIGALLILHSIDSDITVIGFGNRRFAAQLQAMLIPMFGALYFQYNGHRTFLVRSTILALAGFAWMLCIVTAGRGSVVALASSLLVLVFLGRDAWMRWAKYFCATLAIGFLLFVLMFVLLPDLFGATMNWDDRFVLSTTDSGLNSATGRAFIWAKSLKMAFDSPILGIGPMHFAYEFHNEGAHPHNLVLQLMAEWGFFAMLCFVGVLLYGYGRFWRFAVKRAALHGADQGLQMTAEGLLAVLTVIAVYSMIDGLFVMPYSQMLIVLFAAWAMAIMRQASKQLPGDVMPSLSPKRLTQFFLVPALAVALVSIAVTGFPGIFKGKEREDAYERRTNIDLLFPRFWAQGWIGPLPARNN